MCEWAQKNPKKVPTLVDLSDMVTRSNRADWGGKRMIVIAQTPDKMPVKTASALIGGAYHEAFHTVYTYRGDLEVRQIGPEVIRRWPKIADWAPHTKFLLTLTNLIEDIRIERNGVRRYPGTREKLCNIQDFILDLEAAGLENIQSHNAPTKKKKKADKEQQPVVPEAPKKRSSIGTIIGLIRDLGKGYSTDATRRAMGIYEKENPEVFDLVVNGPVRPYLDQARSLTGTDVHENIWLAMDILAELVNQSNSVEDSEGEESQEGQMGDGTITCPHCGAEADKIIVRPKYDSNGVVIKGKGIATCTVCGHQEEVDVTGGKRSTKSSNSGSKSPKFEGFDSSMFDDGDEDCEDEGDGESGEADGGDSQSGGGKSTNKGAGGHYYDPDRIQGNNWEDICKDILEHTGEDTGAVTDIDKILENEVTRAVKSMENHTLKNESIWNPADASLDKDLFVQESYKGRLWDTKQANFLLSSVRAQTSFLRARFRNLVRTTAMRSVSHGLRKGKDLSERFMTDTVTTLRAGQMPTRAFYNESEAIDLTMAAAVVVDESGSMQGQLQEIATKIMLSIIEPLDGLNCPTLAIGIRDGEGYGGGNSESQNSHHRYHGVTYDIFKTWNDRFQSVKWRFANTRAEGGTPLSDGIQYALDALEMRPEAHRFLFVATDGCPNSGHESVINWQCRIAKERGIYIIGVGIGSGAEYVKNIFHDYVYTEKFEQFPTLLINKLTELVRKRSKKEGD